MHPPDPRDHLGSDGVRTRVLVVDGDRRVRTALATLLAAAPGFQIVAAVGDAPSAIAATNAAVAAGTPVEVAVVDAQLPDLAGGLSAMRRLSRSRVAVVAISAQANARGQAIAAGAIAFVDKGGAPEHILTAAYAAADHARETPA